MLFCSWLLIPLLRRWVDNFDFRNNGYIIIKLLLRKESLNSNGQQFHQYQQNKESLNSNGQQFHQYQQNK